VIWVTRPCAVGDLCSQRICAQSARVAGQKVKSLTTAIASKGHSTLLTVRCSCARQDESILTCFGRQQGLEQLNWRCALNCLSAQLVQILNTEVNEQAAREREQADARANCVSREMMRVGVTRTSGRGISLPSAPYSDARSVSNGMSAFPRWPAEATSPQRRCGRQR
jgi:hypothetical protein